MKNKIIKVEKQIFTILNEIHGKLVLKYGTWKYEDLIRTKRQTVEWYFYFIISQLKDIFQSSQVLYHKEEFIPTISMVILARATLERWVRIGYLNILTINILEKVTFEFGKAYMQILYDEIIAISELNRRIPKAMNLTTINTIIKNSFPKQSEFKIVDRNLIVNAFEKIPEYRIYSFKNSFQSKLNEIIEASHETQSNRTRFVYSVLSQVDHSNLSSSVYIEEIGIDAIYLILLENIVNVLNVYNNIFFKNLSVTKIISSIKAEITEIFKLFSKNKP